MVVVDLTELRKITGLPLFELAKLIEKNVEYNFVQLLREVKSEESRVS